MERELTVDAFRNLMFERFPELRDQAERESAFGLTMLEVELLRRRAERAIADGDAGSAKEVCLFVEEVFTLQNGIHVDVSIALEISFIEDLMSGDPAVWSAMQSHLGPSTAERIRRVRANVGVGPLASSHPEISLLAFVVASMLVGSVALYVLGYRVAALSALFLLFLGVIVLRVRRSSKSA